jgi:DNA-binding NarL/FixJ family response regulator
VQEFRHQHPPARLLLLSREEDMTIVHRGFQAGAHAFLSKADALPDFRQVLQSMEEGKKYLSARLRMRSLLRLDQEDERAEKVKRLSNRELFVFRLVGRHKGVSAIASELGLSVKTIETHQSRIKEKLAIASCATLRAYAIEWVAGASEAKEPLDATK